VAGQVARSLTEEQRSLLEFLLGVEFPGVTAFRAQARHAEDRRGSGPGDFLDFGLDVDRSLAEPATLASDVPWVVIALYSSPDGTPAGECILFQAHGWLDAVEITWFGDDPPSTVPPPSLCSPPEANPLLFHGAPARHRW
jgi:hypothetical protein